jgi:hemerythrin superfamily protein
VNALSLLQQEHQAIRSHFTELWDTPGVARQLERVRELAAMILLHAQAEEQYLYAAVEDTGDAEASALVAHSREEHARIEDLIEALVGADAGHEATAAGVTELERTVLAHLRDEEGRFFPLAQRLLGDARLVALGRVMDEWRLGLDAAA